MGNQVLKRLGLGEHTVQSLGNDFMSADDFVMDSVQALQVSNFVTRNSLAAWKFTTSDSSIVAALACDGGTGRIGILVNGVWYGTATCAADSVVRDVGVNLGVGAKTVEIWASNQASAQGCYVQGFKGNIAPIVETPARRMVVYGDSISSGYFGTINERDGWLSLIRGDYPGRCSLEAWGGRSLTTDPLGNASAIAERLTALCFEAITRDIWLAIGTNDWGFSYNLAAFQAKYGELLDALIATNSGASIFATSPIVRSSDGTPNANGDILQDFRDAIETEANARPQITFVNGLTLASLVNLPDGTHPNNTGFIEMKTNIKTLVYP